MSHTLTTLFLLCVGACAGYIAQFLHLPLPWMLGSLIACALIAIARPISLPKDYGFPHKFRLVFIAIVGLMIGSQVTLDTIFTAADLWPSLIGILVFVVLAHGYNYWAFTRIGHYDAPTAFYSGAPGGLMESIAFGEAHGCDIKILTIQQFLRLIVVIILVPTLMSFWIGHPVGSASGQTFQHSGEPFGPFDAVIAAGVGAFGLWFGSKLSLPAKQLMGPLIAAAFLSVIGLVTIDLPDWALASAQVVIGASLGSRFAGLTRSTLQKAIGLSLISVFGMITIGAALSVFLYHTTGLELDMLLISFAPGGVTEMSLIALSVNANSALVSLHHLVRISATVVGLSYFGKRLKTNQ